jgi:hypothetical protein
MISVQECGGDPIIGAHYEVQRLEELERGDLSTLSELAKGWGDPNPGRVERLNRRGFVAKKENQKLQVTLKGRLALWVRRHSR